MKIASNLVAVGKSGRIASCFSVYLVGIGLATCLVPREAFAQIIVRSGNLNTSGQTGTGLADISYNGGATWSRIAVGVETSTTYGNAQGSGAYIASPTDLTGRLTSATAGALTNVGATAYEGNIVNTQSLQVTGDTVAYTRIFFSFTAPTSNFTVSNGFFRSDNGAYDAILNYGTPASQKTMNTFALNATSAPGSNAMRTTTNVPSSVQFSDTRSFAGGGTQDFSFVYYNNSGISNSNFQVQFQPVPAPPAAVSLAIGSGVGLLGTMLRRRKRTKKA